MKKKQRPNPVAKHSCTYNQSVVFRDKKRALKRGEHKHRRQEDSQAA